MILDEKHEEFRARIRDFATREVEPRSRELDRKGEFPWDLVKRMRELGLLAIYVPKEYGGAGLDTLYYSIAVEEIGRVCGSTGIFLAAHSSLGVFPVYYAGNEAQKKKWLVPMAKGEKIGSFGLTEPDAGSDAAATKTTAIQEGDEYVVNGVKRFITSGSVADVIVFTATQDPSKGYHGISAFVVEKGTPGFTYGKDEEKLGLHGSITSELLFEDCRIPKGNILGKEGDGFKIFMETLDGGRISIGALALGIAQGALDASVEFAKRNKRAGKPIYKAQSTQSMIAEMATEVEAARLLVYQAAALKDAGLPYLKEAAMAKYYASTIGMKAASMAIEIHGMLGITDMYPVERFIRDEKLMEIGEGTSEIQKIVIARQILGK
ncbi:acyl-CoA dehydrogenase [candidate division WOR_3 bacterium SM23_42]|uniref:Acyl-CoA dehydrogenase n=1 Tax=candidate division WOR_3 bacterium SM23_42 TaxID=1703779 RepID=A0A0S8FSE0_UNCW3|nr:MAG: acyl-CoA dehydrogenase [candidate division WOR_3 bacterium SM23_42]